MADGNRMVFLGFGKYARADKIYAIEPIRDERRGHGRRTLVWVEGVSEPMEIVSIRPSLADCTVGMSRPAVAARTISPSHDEPRDVWNAKRKTARKSARQAPA